MHNLTSPLYLLEEIIGVRPGVDEVMLPDVLGLDDVEHGGDVLRGVLDELCADDALEDLLLVRLVLGGVDHAGAVDQVDLLHQFDVLPDLGGK